MLSFFKPASPASEQPDGAEGPVHVDPPTPDIAEAAIPVQNAPASSPHTQPSANPEPRPSSATIPTIDSTPTVQGPPADVSQTSVQPRAVPLPSSPNPAASLLPPPQAVAQGSASSVHTQSSAQSDRPMQSQSQSALPYSPSDVNPAGKDPRRFSFPSFSFLRSDAKQSKTRNSPSSQTAAASKATEKNFKVGRALSVLIVGSAASSERRAKESAVVVHSVIVGDHNTSDLKSKIKPSKSDVARVKAQLLEPKTAARVIANLRALPAHPSDIAKKTNLPIHAVCLDMPDKDVHDQYFAQFQSVATASVAAVSTALADVHLVDLITAPNMGLGAPITAQGLFAGALPTAGTVIEGIEQITPQLMALGYATGKAVLPDHKGVIVPTDRISALTYWWGFEICLPPPTIAHLEAAESPCNALLNLLTALSVLTEGVREILPFIRYIAQFAESEWSLIKRADEGKGVVCTATWLLPIALVPRPWDFSDPPPPHTETGTAGQSAPMSPPVQRLSATLTTPKPSMDVPNHSAPRSSSAYSAETKDTEESRPIISSQPPVLPEVVVSSPGSIDGVHRGSGDGEARNTYEKVQHDGEATAH